MAPLATLFLLRLGAFSLALLLLPRRFLPWSVRLSFLIVLLLAVMSPGAPGLLELFRRGPGDFLGPVPWSGAFREVALGLLAGTALSMTAAAALLLGRWVAVLLAGPSAVPHGCIEPAAGALRSIDYAVSLSLFVVLLQAGVLEKSIEIAADIALPGSAADLSSAGGVGVVRLVLSRSFSAAFVIGIPFFLFTLMLDAAGAVLRRYASEFASPAVWSAGRTLSVCAALLFFLGLFTSDLMRAADAGTSAGRTLISGAISVAPK